MKKEVNGMFYAIALTIIFLSSFYFLIDMNIIVAIGCFIITGIVWPYVIINKGKQLINHYTYNEIRKEFNDLSGTLTSNENTDTYDFRMGNLPIRDYSGKDIGHQGPISIVNKYMKKQLDSYNDRKILENHKK